MTTISGDETTTRDHQGGMLNWLFGRLRSAPAAPEVPARIGRYRILGRLGEGGMGLVLLGEDESLRRKVAIKTLKKKDRASKRRFLSEARAQARVSHPNLCPIFEVGQDRRRPFLAMELLRGETLAARLRRGPLSPAEALDLAEDLLAGLTALHEAGLVHRDLKPSNVFLCPRARLVDFGLSREMPSEVASALRSTTTELTLPGIIVGTPGYMAPEQILGHTVDGRADLFAVGAILYEALAGRAPFGGETVGEVLSASLYEEPPPFGASPELRAMETPIRRALSKKPGGRFATAKEAADALWATAREVANATGSGREVFVGRQAELEWLEKRFAAAVAGAGSVAFVTGERGVGKSTLASELMRRVKKLPMAVSISAGRCAETQGPGEAFLPFLDATGRLLSGQGRDQTSELLRTYAPTVCVQMPGGLLPDPDGALRRQTTGASKERLIREAGDFMEAACRTYPVLLLLEDMQWADPGSVDLLHHMGCRLARQRTLIVVALRRDVVEAANAPLKRCLLDLVARGVGHELALGAFTEEDVAAYLQARFPGPPLPRGLTAAIFARSEGLPLFVRSLVDLLVERGDIVREGSGSVLLRRVEDLDLAPTKGLQDLVRQHLEGLAPAEREILEVASVAGREFLSPLIAHLVGTDVRKVEEHLRRLERLRRLIIEAREEVLPDGTPATRYRFAHSLYAEVLRDDVVASRRHELHRAIAGRLKAHWGEEAPRIATEIAGHCEEGFDHAGAVVFRGHAGDNAARLFAYVEAEEHYDWAFRAAAKLAGEERASAAIELHRRRGGVRLAQASFDLAVEDFESMLTLARAEGAVDAERAALAGLCDALFFAQRLEPMAARARELVAVAERAGSQSAHAEADARMGQVLAAQGRLEEAIPLLESAITASWRTGFGALHIALVYRALIHYFNAEYGAAEGRSAEAAAAARERGDGFYTLAAWMFTGLARGNLGRFSEALDDFEDAAAAARRNDDWYWLPRLVSHMGWVHRELGALGRAREFDTEALRIARERPAWGPEAEVLLNLCVDEVREGRVEEASSLLRELRSRTEERTLLKWVSELRVAAASAEHWAARGEPEQAAEHAGNLVSLALRLGARDYACSGARIGAECALVRGAALGAAAADLESAIAGLRPTPAPLALWKSARVLGLLKKRLGDEDGARVAFAEAARAVRTIAAGTRDPALRGGFLASKDVREVLEAAPLDDTSDLSP